MSIPKIKEVGTDRANFYGVRFRPPGQFVQMRTPHWAMNISQSVSQGSEVVMGLTPAGNWLVQTVLIKKVAGDKRYARRVAKKIVRKIES